MTFCPPARALALPASQSSRSTSSPASNRWREWQGALSPTPGLGVRIPASAGTLAGMLGISEGAEPQASCGRRALEMPYVRFTRAAGRWCAQPLPPPAPNFFLSTTHPRRLGDRQTSPRRAPRVAPPRQPRVVRHRERTRGGRSETHCSSSVPPGGTTRYDPPPGSHARADRTAGVAGPRGTLLAGWGTTRGPPLPGARTPDPRAARSSRTPEPPPPDSQPPDSQPDKSSRSASSPTRPSAVPRPGPLSLGPGTPPGTPGG